jgi:hypothetical protein
MLRFRRVLSIAEDILPRIPSDRLTDGGETCEDEDTEREGEGGREREIKSLKEKERER